MAINSLFFARILGSVKSIIPTVKTWLVADGKFRFDRAMILLLFFAAVGICTYFLGPEQTANIIDMLDDVSDIIGLISE